jgi:uncharacterized protein YyaL (SSP411 family)
MAMANRLIGETSPYLLQHAENPVDWHPWGDEAFDLAVAEGKPVLVSIGYSACHWCHVMAHESFENPEIAAIMNDNFVNIKVDREERPDIDAIHMEAVQAITGSGGWPLTVFLTPERKPFYGGTYFPPEDRQGMPGFPSVLRTVADAYRNRRDQVQGAADDVVSHLNRSLQAQPSSEPLTFDILKTASIPIQAAFDRQHGGLGTAPKFPQPMVLEYLLRHYRRTGDAEALSMVELTLTSMAKGGIYDQVGGGFHRYSVDARWLVPHFEKMLYDNALLSRLYLHAYQVARKETYRRVVEETLDYMLREMRSGAGGFYSSQDADSEGVEGKYYTWTLEELIEALGVEEGKLAARYFGVTEQGNFEGRSIPSQALEAAQLASETGLGLEEIGERIGKARAGLLRKRGNRVRPHCDDKILTDWNGLALAALAEAGSALGREDYLEAAVSCARFIEAMRDAEGLKHAYRHGQARISGFLSDYALACDGLVALYQASLEARWLRGAVELADAMVDRFWDEPSQSFWDAGRDQLELVVRPRNVFDNALPSGPSAASFALLRLARLTRNQEYERLAAAALRGVQGLMIRYPSGFGHWLCALDLYLSKPQEIVVAGPADDPATRSLVRVINERYLPNCVVAGVDPTDGPPARDIPILHDKTMLGDRPAAYVCEAYTCREPTGDPYELASHLDRMT